MGISNRPLIKPVRVRATQTDDAHMDQHLSVSGLGQLHLRDFELRWTREDSCGDGPVLHLAPGVDVVDQPFTAGFTTSIMVSMVSWS